MENRFGIKDFFLFITLAIIVILLCLCLKQYDRQWDQIGELKGNISNLTNDLTQIRNAVSQGITVRNDSGSGLAPSTNPIDDPFHSIREAMAKPDWATGDWLVENFGTSIGKLTPLISTDIYAAWVQVKTMESFCYRDPETLEYGPLLATSWEISPDGTTMSFNLRKGVVFSDGVPMTSKDVKFTFDWIMDPKIDAARSRAYLDHLESVTTEGDYRVTFKFKKFVFNTFSTIVETLIMPEHFYSKYTSTQFNEMPGLLMGTGPYRMPTPDGWTPGTRVEIVRNERYWGVQSAFDRIVYYDVKDEVAEETMYRNREVDRFVPTPEQFEKLKKDAAITGRSSTWEYYSPVAGYNFVGWNEKKAGSPTHFADKRVRQAMTMLVDRDRIARELWMGHATAATGPFGYGSPQSDPDIKPWPYDPERAKKLLAEAGYIDRNNDGVLDSPDGKPFEFAMSYPSGNPFTDRIVLFLKDALAQAGVKMNLDAVDWPIFVKRLDTRDFDAVILGWSTSIETDCNQIFHSSQIKDQGDDFVSYASAECDAAIDKARATVDEKQRMEAWRAVHRILHEDQPYTFMLARQSIGFTDSRIKNIHKTKLGLNMVLTEMTPLPWYVPKAEQLHKTAN